MVSFNLAVLKTSTGRLLLVWNSNPDIINCGYSDDKGHSWIDTIRIPGPWSSSQYSMLEINHGKIVLSFTSPTKWRTRLSLDNGETWSDEYYFEYRLFPLPLENPSLVKLSENGDSLLGIFSIRSTGVIYSIISTDAGTTWSDTTRIIATNITPGFPQLKKINTFQDQAGNIWLFYNAFYETGYEDYLQTDVSVLVSSDNGINWHQQNNFTSYLGDDNLTGITSNGEDVFVCFNSSRTEVFNQGYYGIVGESDDVITPPVLLKGENVETNYETNEFIYNALIVDEEAVSQVYLDLEEGTYVSKLFDDGMHNDSLDGDNIWGNTFPILTPIFGIPYGDAYAIEVNKISLPFNDSGILADVYAYGFNLGAEIKMSDVQNFTSKKDVSIGIPFRNQGSGGKYEEGGFLFSGGFWLSGYNGDSLWSNAVSSAMLVEDYLSGRVGSDSDDPLNRMYTINKKDVPFGYTWQNWKDAVSLGAEFYDGDGDGIYSPFDKNWNGTWDINEDMPMLIGDETIWCVYNDGIPANLRRWNTVEPQGIEIRQTVFASDNPDLENVVFIKYSILNTGTVADEMDSVYFGIWEDGDLGDHTDDVVGCDTLLNSGFYYNNTPDGIYGENCPSFFTTYLQGPIIQTNEITDSAKINYGTLIGSENISGARNQDISAHNFLIGGDPNLNDPRNKIEARNYIEGKNRIGEYPNPCNFAYCQVRGGVNCNEVNPHFWASGDPVNDIGWINSMNLDHKNLVSTGPFKLEKDKPQEIIIAYVMGRGIDYFNSITVARENVLRAIQEYESNFASMTYQSPPPTNPVADYILYQNYPNPFNPATTIRYELPQDGIVTIDIYDILGQRVRTILNEFQKASRYEVNFNAIGLASGVYIYRMKVNDFITSKKMVLVR
ncbi:MAG: hypothetical protein DRQ13_01300 [Ignavibacteriae bacterium]|nr:MAG: hypothetical protein DRQ13_01300 [Ignavibacteriota bacterium]